MGQVKERLVLTDLNGNPVSDLHMGDQVTFEVTSDLEYPNVSVEGYQGGKLVYGESHGWWPGAMGGHTFTLGPTQLWTAGDADCRAYIYDPTKQHVHELGEIDFHVSG